MAGVLVSMTAQITPFIRFPYTNPAFEVITIGGLGNIGAGVLPASTPAWSKPIEALLPRPAEMFAWLFACCHGIKSCVVTMSRILLSKLKHFSTVNDEG